MKINHIIGVLMFVLIGSLLSSVAFPQTTWYKYPGNPVIKYSDSDVWDQVCIPLTVLFEDDQYHLWYKGWSTKNAANTIGIGYATSPDGIHWQKNDNNPLEFRCNSEPWDLECCYRSFDILKLEALYTMWYVGFDKRDSTTKIGFAWSENGLKWTKHPEPLLKPGKEGEWDDAYLNNAEVYFDGIRYHMWYNGVNKRDWKTKVGYATSDDGILWEKHPANPVLDVGEPGAWDDHAAGICSVIFNDSCYEMCYDGWDKINTQVGYATSVDGYNWVKSPHNPVLPAGELGMWDTWISRIANVVCQDSIYRMWYYGCTGSDCNIGYATTSVREANAWGSDTQNKPQKIYKVKLFNRDERINVDSLAEVLPQLSETELIDALNKLALAYSLNDSLKSLRYANKALGLAKQANYQEGRAMALYCIGNTLYVLDNYADALANQLSALWLFDSLEMYFEYGNLLSQIASIHSYSGSYGLACRYYQQALDVFENQNDTNYIMTSLVYLGFAYLQDGDTTKALNVFRRRLSLATAIHDNIITANAYETIGLCYSGRNLDSALVYFDRARNIWDSVPSPAWTLPENLLITAEAYYSAGPDHYKEAEKYFVKCYPRFHGGLGKVRLFYGVAQLFFDTRDYNRSKHFLNISLNECKLNLERSTHKQFTSLNQKLRNEHELRLYMEKIYRLYYRLDTARYDKGAFKYFILATQWKERIFDEQKRRQMALLQGSFENESALNHMNMLVKENEVMDLQVRQSQTFLFGMGGFVLILIFMAWLFIRQNKIRAEHKSVILEQKLLRLQMNPHFIFNALSNIMNFIEKKNTDKA
ncbi:tetratricopeptide repeat protein, partial [Bacteroidota bacterium]